MSFVHLHNHSHYSLLDGAQNIQKMIKKTKELKMSSIALTDHGNMYGAMEFYTTARKEGIHPILGMEAYIIGKGKRQIRKRGDKTSRDNSVYHLILLCENEIGYKNLIKLTSLSFTEGFYYKPRIDKELLGQYSEGLIALSACLAGELTNQHLRDNIVEAKVVLEEYMDIFGKNNFFVELQRHGMKEDVAYEKNYRLAQELGARFVATNDVHYTEKEHWESHDILICMQGGKTRDDERRHRYEPEEFYLRSAEEMRELFHDIPEACDTTLEIANRCQLEISFNDYKMPTFPIPKEEGNITADEYLRLKTKRGIKKRYSKITTEISERMEYELRVIQEMGFSSYFLITLDFIEAAREKNIPVGLGRGSAAGSIVAYATRITSVDPLKYNLLFERFLNPERVSMPDVDIDFCMRRRDEVIEYVRNKYGQDNVCQIITYGTLASKNAIKDVARVLDIPFDKSNQITKLIPVEAGKPWSVKKSFSEIPELAALLESNDPVYKELARHAEVLEGSAKSIGIHAAGVIIAPEAVSNLVPVAKNNDGVIISQYDMKYSEMIGLLKMDFLGLRTLTVIFDAVKMIRELDDDYADFDIDKIPMDDERTYKLYGQGNTVGIFQFESKGMQEYLRKLKPNRIGDLIAMNALYRPGPMQFIDDFIDRKYGRKRVDYLHSMLEPILDETYGIIVYQEQVMKIVSEMGGFSLGEADIVRRAMGKKQHDVMEEYKDKFLKQAKAMNQIDEKTSAEIYDMIVRFASYGFNKSHSAAYSILSYQTAYLKTHFPAQFMASIMSSEINSSDRIVIYMNECKNLGLTVIPPDINISFPDFSAPDEKTVAFGMHAIKNVGLAAIDSIVAARQERGKKFKSIFELLEFSDSRLLSKKVMEALAQSGALDTLEGTRAQKFLSIETATEFASKLNNSKEDENQFSLFGEENKQIKITYPKLEEMDEWSSSELLRREKDLLGFYISGHPVERYKKVIEFISTVKVSELDKTHNDNKGRIAGMITAIKPHLTRKGDKMAFVKAENFDFAFEVVIFSNVYQQHIDLIKEAAILIFSGKTSYTSAKDIKILADDIFPIDQAEDIYVKAITLTIDLSFFDSKKISDLNQVLTHEIGEVPVYFKILSTGNGSIKMLSNKLKISSKSLNSVKDIIGSENVLVAFQT